MESTIVSLDDIKFNEKKVSDIAKKLMETLHINISENVKRHLEKAYEIGYQDAISEVKKVIKTDLSKTK
jgi:hypothetical protein